MRVAMDQDGMLMFAPRSTPTTQLIVTWVSPTAVDLEVTTVDLSIEVSDVDAAFERARDDGWSIVREVRDDGWSIVREVRDEPWGIRRFFVRDPAGRVVNVAAHIASGAGQR